MSRRHAAEKREVLPDAKYGSIVVTKFMNTMMYAGKKSVAEQIVYGAFEQMQKKVGGDPVKIFDDALSNVKPQLEVRSRRVGGATYQVPVEVRPERAQALAIRWIIQNARSRAEQTMTVTPRMRSVPDPIFRELRETWDIGAGLQAIPLISAVTADSPASRAGLKAGDVVIAVAGQAVYTPDELVEGIRSRPGQAFPITIERVGKQLTLTVTPDAVR